MPNKTKFMLIGLMSGTSGDGLDIAHCIFQLDLRWKFEITKSSTIPFPEELGNRLKSSHLLPAYDLEKLDHQFGTWMGEEVKKFCLQNGLQPEAIASHGHTVFHRPEEQITKQIGNGYSLWKAAGIPVINDFRQLDVVLGGQGAPLAPMGDARLFGEYDFALNLGGIANLSMEDNGQRLAYDVCPFNLLFNHLTEKLGEPFDRNGQWAMEGVIIPDLLKKLEGLDYYKTKGAKSLAREDIENVYLPLIENGETDTKDLLATLSEHFAGRIAGPLLKNQNNTKKSLLVTGGGAYNTYFIKKLTTKLNNKVNVILPEPTIIDFKEALVFAFLGLLRLRGENNCFASVTGAERDNCGGTLFGFI
jgi:anhydro-N-acetylmuramic acid kinase